MKQKKIWLIAALILTALFTRVFQIFYSIDFMTGFYKRKTSVIGLILMVIVVVLCAAASLLSIKTFKITNESSAVSGSTAITSAIMSLALFYELVIENFALQGTVWQSYAMKVVGFATAAYFLFVALSGVMKFKIPDLFHTLPAFYMIIRIICSFINISSLSLIAENIFLLASLCCALLFFVSYAAFYCLDERKPDVLSVKSVMAGSFCFVTAVSNIAANIFGGIYNHIPTSSQVVLMALAIFIANFLFDKCFKKVSE